MNAKYLFAIVLLLSGFLSSAQEKKENSAVMIENPSRFGFTETIDTLSKAIIEKGWKITVTHDLQETMKKNGKVVLPVKVMELCNPGLAYQILSKDELREVSPMLPCRISVYEKSDGITYVSRMNAPVFAGMIHAEAAKTINLAFREAEDFLKTVIR